MNLQAGFHGLCAMKHAYGTILCILDHARGRRKDIEPVTQRVTPNSASWAFLFTRYEKNPLATIKASQCTLIRTSFWIILRSTLSWGQRTLLCQRKDGCRGYGLTSKDSLCLYVFQLLWADSVRSSIMLSFSFPRAPSIDCLFCCILVHSACWTRY